jgi:chromosomal replication initiation ATPase DnaA
MTHLADDDRAALKTLFPKHRVQEIAKEVSKWSCLPVSVILGRSQKQHIVAARDMVIYVFHRETEASLPAIARAFGMHHTSIMDALNRERKRRSPPE